MVKVDINSVRENVNNKSSNLVYAGQTKRVVWNNRRRNRTI